MAALPDARHTFAARVVSLALCAAAVGSLSGCGVDYASTAPVFPGDYRERHPIVVASAPTSIDIYPIAGGLDERSMGNIRAFVQRYRHFGAGTVTVLTPIGASPGSKAVNAIRRALVDAGLDGKVVFAAYALPGKGTAAPIRLSFMGVKAVVPTPCGQWPEDLASGSSLQGWRNESYSNFGCATQSMLAAQVDDPRDFVQPRELGPSDVVMRTRAIEAVREGKDPGTEWKDTVLTPIGGALGGGGQ